MSSGGFDTEQGSAFASTAGNVCYSMEVKDAVLPPWVVSGLCAAMSLDATSFDLTYVRATTPPPDTDSSSVLSFCRGFSRRIATEPSSMGLNVALDSMGTTTTDVQPEESTPSSCSAPTTPLVGAVPDAALVPALHSASLRRLTYTDGGGYVAHTTV
jgi:protein downstream neighbor of Son